MILGFKIGDRSSETGKSLFEAIKSPAFPMVSYTFCIKKSILSKILHRRSKRLGDEGADYWLPYQNFLPARPLVGYTFLGKMNSPSVILFGKKYIF